MKRLALMLLALGMNVHAATLTLNDARVRARRGNPERLSCARSARR